jgi:flagellin-like protein
MDKKGVSPLIATIILIAMSVGMGVAVMSWGEEYIEGKAEFVQGIQETVTSCDTVSMSIVTISGVQQLCIAGTIVKGLIDNGPDANIEEIHARVIGESGISVDESILSQPLPRGSAAQVTIESGAVGAVSQIKLTPSIIIGGKTVACAKQAVLAENIKPC